MDKDKMLEWFIEDVEEQLSWSEIDLTDELIREIAEKKTTALIDYMES